MVCSRGKDEERVQQLDENTEIGEGGKGLEGLSLLVDGSFVFILYSICITLQLGACVGPGEA